MTGAERLADEEAHDTLATRLARFARRMPHGEALVAGHERLSWAALDEQVSTIASAVVTAAASARGNVCLMLDDRAAAVKAILGVIRSGHVYVPFDNGDPEARLRFMLADSEPVAVLAAGDSADRARALAPAGCPIVDLDAIPPQATRVAFGPVPSSAVAHVYYTSGSTGQPKGVRQTHANQLHFADAYQRRLGVGEGDRQSLLYSVGYAAALGDLYRGIGLGATLCLYDLGRDGIDGLAGWVDREAIGLLHSFPGVFRELARRITEDRALASLRILQLDGEALFASDVALYRAHTTPRCQLVHQLSATEIAIMAQRVVGHDDVLADGPVIAVGRPMEGVRIDVRRADGSVATTDEVGEVFVQSRYLSPGYWKRPDLDRMAFAADPRTPGERVYRTRDFGRIDAAGALHIVGREGSRAKVRGHTVDLAEVEAALAGCADAAASAVAIEGDLDDSLSTRLVAYVEARAGAARDPARIRRHLADTLPRHMLPAEIRYVEALPRTPGGKLDRLRLAQAVRLPAQPAAATPPRDALEAAVAHMFGELLDLQGEPVGMDSDFFLLGGDSLVAADLQARIEEAFGVRVHDLHRDTTVAAVTRRLREALGDARPCNVPMPLLVPLRREGARTPLFVVHGRQGQAYVSPRFMKLLGDDQPAWAFQARGLDGASEPHPSVEAMVDDYVTALREVQPRGPYFLGGLCIGGYIAAAMARKLRADGEKLLPLLLLDPPNHTRGRPSAEVDGARVADKLLARRTAGGLNVAVEDPGLLASSVRTALAFEQAVARYRPQPYDGPMYVLSSWQRMHLGDPFELRKAFTGRVKRYEVGHAHGDALDPRNPLFVSTLKRCLDLIRAATPA